jgi:hypothetical protein
MVNLENIFDVDIKTTEDGSDIHFLKIDDINDNFQSLVDTYIVSICDSEDDTPIDIIRAELRKGWSTSAVFPLYFQFLFL